MADEVAGRPRPGGSHRPSARPTPRGAVSCVPLEPRALLTATALADAYSVISGVPSSAGAQQGVLADDAIASGNAPSVSANTTPSHGMLAMNSGGTFTYTADSGDVGTDSFSYAASDGRGNDHHVRRGP
ncbi:Ig-like domain-containing protein [Aquisphaera giovannonii]|nr:Ig-like domain-containing protein [Aquisphaera giovannonii]